MTDFVPFILNRLVLHLGREIRNGFADAKKNLYPSFGEFSLQINKRLGVEVASFNHQLVWQLM
jgi:hypothetical protein